MVEVKELIQFNTLKNFTEQELAKLASIGHLHIFSEGKKIFVQNSTLKNIYLMLSGEISLTFEASSQVIFILSNLRPGTFFGISSICRVKSFHNAYCYKPSEVVVFPIEKLEDIFRQDKDLGYKFTYEMLKFYHKVTQSRTWDTLKTINQRKEIIASLEDLPYLDFSV